jgi:hypothetical protein
MDNGIRGLFLNQVMNQFFVADIAQHKPLTVICRDAGKVFKIARVGQFV